MSNSYLLDTHAFIWLATDDEQLTPKIRELFLNRDNALLFSSASVWELAIKASRKKLTLPDSVASFVSKQMLANGIRDLEITREHAITVGSLDWYHSDPFDRLLVAQARCEDLILLSADPIFDRYGIAREW